MASALALGIERFDDGQQFRPRNEGFHAREKLLAAGDLLFIRKLGLGKTGLMRHANILFILLTDVIYKLKKETIKSAFP